MNRREKIEPSADALEALARCLYPAMVEYFQSEEGQREFAEWQAHQGTDISPRREASPTKKSEQVA
jgi:hypothetical protein